MNLSKAAATLIQATNLVLLIRESGANMQKFAAWEAENPESEVLTGLDVIDISFENNIKTFEHPLEDGTVITDHMIIEPDSATLQALIGSDDNTTLTELNNYCLSGTPLKIRVENKVIPQAIIKGLPFKLSGQYFDKTPYSIAIKQVQTVTPVYVGMSNAKNASNTSRVNSGVKQAKKTKKENVSWIKQVATALLKI